jgi:large conductance mechanosensitive channel
MLKEFQEFAFKGSLLDLAIGLILGTAFGKLVASLVTDVIMPPIGLLLGRVDFANLFINLSDKPYASLTDARAAGAPVIAFGAFLNTIINFLIVAIVVFMIIRPFNRAKEKAEGEEDAKELEDKAREALDEREKEKESAGEAPKAEGEDAAQPQSVDTSDSASE